MHFGVTDRAGKPKAALREIGRFSSLVTQLSTDGWERAQPEVAIVVPEHFERTAPYSTPDYRKDIRGILGQAYIAAREADLPVAFARGSATGDKTAEGIKLYLLPSTKLITAPTVGDLLAAAEQGATVYLSYFAGSSLTQRGSWVPWLRRDVFGIRHHLRYGLVDTVEDDQRGLHLRRGHGPAVDRHRAQLPRIRQRRISCLPAARARRGQDLGRRRFGPTLRSSSARLGAVPWCCAPYPIEHMAASTPHANPENTWRLYGALASTAGVTLPLTVNDPRVMVGCLQSGGQEIALVVNMSPERLEVKLVTARRFLLWHDTGRPRPRR